MFGEMGVYRGDVSNHKNWAFEFCDTAFLLEGLTLKLFSGSGQMGRCVLVWVAQQDSQQDGRRTPGLMLPTPQAQKSDFANILQIPVSSNDANANLLIFGERYYCHPGGVCKSALSTCRHFF